MSATTSLMPASPVVTSEQVDLIKRTIAPEASADELKLYLFDCARQGVHPLDKLVHFTKRGGRYTPITSIDFMRMRAADTGECAGIDDAVFEGSPKGADFVAHVTVYRILAGQRWPFSATARWAEYCPPAGQNHMWLKMPHTMLGKCAEALALRKGFPRQLAGLYAKEELDQANGNTIEAVAEPPAKVSAPVIEKVEKDYSSTQNTKPAVDLPPGTVRIDRVDRNKTKKGNPFALVTLSTGELTQTFDHVLMLECETFAMANEPVVVGIGPEKYGYPQLTSAKRFEQALPLDVTLDEPIQEPDADYPF